MPRCRSVDVYDDNNDGGKSGFGVMTNEPPFPWQVQAMKLLRWKQAKYGAAVALPGSWYPE